METSLPLTTRRSAPTLALPLPHPRAHTFTPHNTTHGGICEGPSSSCTSCTSSLGAAGVFVCCICVCGCWTVYCAARGCGAGMRVCVWCGEWRADMPADDGCGDGNDGPPTRVALRSLPPRSAPPAPYTPFSPARPPDFPACCLLPL
jgi:hypothetical protein